MGNVLVGVSPERYEIGIILPTYGEAENIGRLIEDIEDLSLDSTILVIDDSSPDETANIVKEKQKTYTNIVLCNRPKKSGLGSAITDGFRFFLNDVKPPKICFYHGR